MKRLNDNKCVVCDATSWLPLYSPNPDRSLTTAGLVLEVPLGKAHCAGCGVAQKVYEEALGQHNFYEKDYQGYYDRPASAPYHRKRYQTMVEWILHGIAPHRPASILDVGCGQGGCLVALGEACPEAVLTGLEPSVDNARQARRLGFEVFGQRLGTDTLPEARYDLAVAIYVLQHVLDPVDFLRGVGAVLHDGGLAAIVVPNGDRPNIELLWSDQNYAFTGGHLAILAKRAGLDFLALHPSPEGLSASWLAILGKNPRQTPVHPGIVPPQTDTAALYAAREKYLRGFTRLDAFLCRQTARKRRVVNFGASFWSSLLAVYCPGYWRRVDVCAVDGDSGRLLDKEVVDMASLVLTDQDAVVPGLAKAGQEALRSRFAASPAAYVPWHDQIAW